MKKAITMTKYQDADGNAIKSKLAQRAGQPRIIQSAHLIFDDLFAIIKKHIETPSPDFIRIPTKNPGEPASSTYFIRSDSLRQNIIFNCVEHGTTIFDTIRMEMNQSIDEFQEFLMSNAKLAVRLYDPVQKNKPLLSAAPGTLVAPTGPVTIPTERPVSTALPRRVFVEHTQTNADVASAQKTSSSLKLVTDLFYVIGTDVLDLKHFVDAKNSKDQEFFMSSMLSKEMTELTGGISFPLVIPPALYGTYDLLSDATEQFNLSGNLRHFNDSRSRAGARIVRLTIAVDVHMSH